MDLLNRIDDMIDERHLLKHPFYTKWSEGTLPREALQEYAQRVEEIRTRLRGSRDPTELQVAADHFVALRHDLDEGMGRAQEIASDSLDYNSRL